ncbi:hypothetical protein AWQ23_00885 [Picosynechococcus sp. PCC 73109]|nr:hypothetical protein AWQ23_00885 [Picosynechococcus sp. PCC 73109]
MRQILLLAALLGFLPVLIPRIALSNPSLIKTKKYSLNQAEDRLVSVKQNSSRLRQKGKDSIELTIVAHWCGNRLAAFESAASGEKVSVRLSYDGSTEIYSNGQKVDDGSTIGWWGFFCPSGRGFKLSGEKVIVDGQWMGIYDDGWVLNASRVHFNSDSTTSSLDVPLKEESSQDPKYVGSSANRALFVIDNYSGHILEDGTIRNSFNVYNLTRVAAAALVYDSSGKRIESRLIRPHVPESGLYAAQKAFIIGLWDVFSKKFSPIDPRNVTNSQVTTLKNIDIPPGGRLVITHQGRDAGLYVYGEQMSSMAEIVVLQILETGFDSSFSSFSPLKKDLTKRVMESVNEKLWDIFRQAELNGDELPGKEVVVDIVAETLMDLDNIPLMRDVLLRAFKVPKPSLLVVAEDVADQVSYIEELFSSEVQASHLRNSNTYIPYILYNSPQNGLQDISQGSIRTPVAQSTYRCTTSSGRTTQLEASFYDENPGPHTGEVVINVDGKTYQLPGLVGNTPSYGNADGSIIFGLRSPEAWLRIGSPIEQSYDCVALYD